MWRLACIGRDAHNLIAFGNRAAHVSTVYIRTKTYSFHALPRQQQLDFQLTACQAERRHHRYLRGCRVVAFTTWADGA